MTANIDAIPDIESTTSYVFTILGYLTNYMVFFSREARILIKKRLTIICAILIATMIIAATIITVLVILRTKRSSGIVFFSVYDMQVVFRYYICFITC